MTTAPTPDEIRRALWENRSAPGGLLRNARGEELVAAAEATGDRDLLRAALFGLIQAYEYSTERGKMMVPFARLMREWDDDPSAFDAHDTHTFHWLFKWVSSGMLTLPEMPLATMEKWLAEMERRYRTAGHSERAVRQAEFELADHVGDGPRAATAFAAWIAAERDTMANCHACELNDQGMYRMDLGDDESALATWAPVLDGTSSCMEEPHRVLAHSLLPLVRTGRADDARAHHLRGYRMAKGNESLLASIGKHIEFCALTGNEARGLEILAEHAAHLDNEGNPWTRLELCGGTLVLLRRLLALGLAEAPAVPYAGRPHTVGELHDALDAVTASLAAAFDRRNGTDTVSSWLRHRLEAAPLTDRLPLGVGTAHPLAAARPAPAAGTAADATGTGAADDVAALVARARELRATGHPGATALWERAGAVLERTGEEPDRVLAVELAEHRALTAARAGAGDARARFEEVAAGYRAVGDENRAALNDLRIVYAALDAGAAPDEVFRLLDAADAAAGALGDGLPHRTRRIATAALTRAKLAVVLAPDGDDEGHEQAHARFDEALTAFAERYASAADVADLVAEAEQIRADQAWQSGFPDAADALYASAAHRTTEAGRPWDAAEPLARRAQLRMALGRPDEAEEFARAALGAGEGLIEGERLGRIRLTLAEAVLAQDGREAEGAEHALEAAHWFDEAGQADGPGAYARLTLAQAYAGAGRAAEAAEVLESALPALTGHGEDTAVRARDTLARCLRDLGDHRGAAEQYLLAADVAKGWDDDRPHAQAATLAAESLAAAGMDDEAGAAYRRAIDLWRAVGEAVPVARALRSLAWLQVRRGEWGAARDLMDEAFAAVADGDAPALLLERARTWTQTAELLLDGVEADDGDAEDGEVPSDDGVPSDGGAGGQAAGGEPAAGVRRDALALLDRADAAFAALGAAALEERVRCAVRAAWTESELDLATEAAGRVRSLMAEISASGDDPDGTLHSRLERTLEHLTS
ncbi:tetratricopeptide repeat protein [Streptomyces genisteinicus]|uniref:Tetratricopeptide repeat protein n=1 Tax=Streptomyces genisteinicus TaxID=2768068 RepID=A0A7H0I1S3_9ACTN|nr:tetratricopeptide repeat protein [Streptomyces genisteinicus]QNP66739.1 tetratricopeptide repeat protein [Streptomyces genisteinicus]